MRKKDETGEFTNSQNRLFELMRRKRKSKKFNAELDTLRGKYNIPKGGFLEKPRDYDLLGSKSFELPNQWKTKKSIENFRKSISVFFNEHELGFFNTFPIHTSWIVFYNTYIFPDNVDLVVLKDITKDRKNKTVVTENYAFPVAILVSPHASKADIIDFINQKTNEIKKLQNKYIHKTSSLPKVRIRNQSKIIERIQSLDGIEKPKQIVEFIKIEFGITKIDEFYVNKVLHKYRKKMR